MGTTFSARDRSQWIRDLTTREFDLVIIGGGITGAGVARDAASRGMSVALVEARDFAEGTSSRSSKLIHGGIRYLENLEFHLVFEALSERRLLFDIAPHLVHPLRFVLPLYQGGRVGMLKMGLGMWLYDALSMFEAPEPHERLDSVESVERLPQLQRRGLLGSYVYSDAYMDDDRLTLETLRSAVRSGAICVNHVKAVGAHMPQGRVEAIECRDEMTGQTLRVSGRHFISTVGPWTDIVGRELLGQWKKVLRPSKGVHLTFARDRLPLKQAVVMAADKDKRIVFGIPRHEMIIIGTTDTDFPEDPSTVGASSSDVRYLLNIAHEYFPGAKLTAEDTVSSYAGVRPLVHDGSESESKTSREHLIYSDPRNITFVAGGKYTTYRRMAEQTVQQALENFSTEDQVRFRLNDTKRALHPLVTVDHLERARREVGNWAREFGCAEKIVQTIVERHGFEAPEILSGLPAVGASDGARLWCAEARHAVAHTMCMGLIDFYVRRAPLFLSFRDHGLSLMPAIAREMQKALNWSDSQCQVQQDALVAYVRKELAWKQEFQINASNF
ncbi:MAG: glycerol-3-phosphate dehydrogenase/oxidase [Bdellovibrionaceae bacterium]|nr:glycerol-3-phosphate dehydrogenase/oxidase [Pseudobdellovibrionaceae bacterium]